MESLKTTLYKEVEQRLNQRLDVIKNKIVDLQNALQSETKSTAGDKHETGRAMLQLEREKAGNQLAELQKQIELLHKINYNLKHSKVALGSIVKTSKANYFISVSIGEITIQTDTYYAISPATPIGQLLLSKEVGDEQEFRGSKFRITEIL